MSAWLCSDLHTYTVAAALVSAGHGSDLISVAASLRDANNKALAARYRDTATPLGPLSEVVIAPRTAQQVNTMARSFRYQCAEGDVLETHPVIPPLMKLIEATGGEDCPTAEGCWSV